LIIIIINHYHHPIKFQIHSIAFINNFSFQLTKQFPTLQKKLTLPPKKLLRNFDPLHVEKRRQSLEAYLQNIVTELGKIPRVLQTFLEFHIYVSETLNSNGVQIPRSS
jgi:hypothetical protein